MKMNLNHEEIGMGVAFGAAMVFLLGLIHATILAVVCGFLWAVGGSGKGRAFRYAGVPLAAFVALFSLGVPVWQGVVSSVLAGVVLSMGYGIPSDHPKDEGSPIGRFFYYRFANQQDGVAALYTRGFLALLLGAAYLPAQGVNLAWAAFLGALVGLHLIVVKWVE